MTAPSAGRPGAGRMAAKRSAGDAVMSMRTMLYVQRLSLITEAARPAGTVQIRRNGPMSWPLSVGHGAAGFSTASQARGSSTLSASNRRIGR